MAEVLVVHVIMVHVQFLVLVITLLLGHALHEQHLAELIVDVDDLRHGIVLVSIVDQIVLSVVLQMLHVQLMERVDDQIILVPQVLLQDILRAHVVALHLGLVLVNTSDRMHRAE